jgi:Ni,Fe-hydrogenase III large subunit
MDEEEHQNIIRGIDTDIDILYQIPQTLRQVKTVCAVLPPKSKVLEKLVKEVQKLRNQLINLDVVCQDIEWSMTDRNLRQQENFLKNFSSNTQTANTY